MSLFTFAITCLTTSNLPWFTHLTFQVPMQFYSLQHQTLLPSPVTPRTGCCLCFGSVSSFFPDLFLHWSPVAYWTPTDLGSSSFRYHHLGVKVKVKLLSHVRLFVTPWTVAHQAPPSMEFSRQEYCSGLPFPSPGDLPDPGIEPGSPALQAHALPSEPPKNPN